MTHGDGYEKRDAQTRPLILLGAGLAVLVLGSLLVSRLLDAGFTPVYEEPPSPTAQSYDAREAPLERTWPVLQSNPYEEIDGHAARMEQVLGSYGWVDRQTGIARIPIERAVDLYLARQGTDAPPGDGGDE